MKGMPKFTLYLTHVLNKKIRTNLTASQIEVNGTSDAQKLFQIQPVRKSMLEIRVNRTVFFMKITMRTGQTGGGRCATC